MNSLIILKEECVEPGLAILKGERKTYFEEYHGLPIGAKTPLSIFGVARGSGEIVKIDKNEINIRFECQEDALKPLAVELLLAVPRPQSVKKIVNTAAMMGIVGIHFFPAEQSQPSYMQSKSLTTSEIQKQTILGLEQTFDCRSPSFEIHRSLKEALTKINIDKRGRILCSTSSAPFIRKAEEGIKRADCTVVALGPELGWTDKEQGLMVAEGFMPYSLGERILRTDVAVSALLGMIKYIQTS